MYIIRSTIEKDDITDRPLYWSNEDGWVDWTNATVFTNAEREVFQWLPLGGEWVEI